MPRVLLFRSELLPLSETFIAAQARALRRYQPWFAGLKRVPDGIALSKSRMIIAAEKNSLREKIARRIFLRTGFAPGLLRRIEDVRPDLIHAHFATDACAALAMQRRLGSPMVVTLHGYDVTSKDSALRASAIGRAYLRRREVLWERVNAFVCISQFVRRKALERGFPEEKLWAHSTGIDLDFFQPSAAQVKAPIVLFVGRLVEVKGCARLLRAMRIVAMRMTDARLVVVGDGPLKAGLEAQARETLERCEFVGAQPATAVREWMRQARVVAIPSDEREGLCMVALEAQAMEIPVVGFHGPGISEAVADGETGVLVEQRNEEALAAAILAVLTDEGLATRMGAAGRLRVQQLFDVKRQTMLLEDRYDEVLRNG